MSQALFRAEAIAAHAQPTAPAGDLRLGHRRTVVAFAALCAAMVASLALSFLVRTDETAHGRALISFDTHQAVVWVPIAAASHLVVGQPVVVRAHGRVLHLAVESVGPVTTSDPSATAAWIQTVAADPATTSADSGAAVAPPVAGDATVVLDRRPVAEVLVPGLRRIVGD